MRGVKARAAVALCGAVLGIAVASADDEWPRFRGSNGGVAADHPSLPDQWGPAQNIVWKIDVPGRSWSSPVVWGDHVFVTTAINTLETESLLPVASYVSRSNGGTMTFTSEEGEGTEFVVVLPKRATVTPGRPQSTP